jgi:hypothetical protein
LWRATGLIRASPGLQSGEAGFQTRENALSCNDRALALVSMSQGPQSTRTFFVTSKTAGRRALLQCEEQNYAERSVSRILFMSRLRSWLSLRSLLSNVGNSFKSGHGMPREQVSLLQVKLRIGVGRSVWVVRDHHDGFPEFSAQEREQRENLVG